MTLADQRDVSAGCRPWLDLAAALRQRTPCWVACILLVAATLAALAASPPALAVNCSSAQANLIARVQCQVAGQGAVLAYFNTLPGLAAGNALLAANLRTEEVLYLGSTQQQRIASGTVFITQGQALQANILLRAFPANPNFGTVRQGCRSRPNCRRRSPGRWIRLSCTPRSSR